MNTTPESAPRYKHDCQTCVFLGRQWHVDLYFHPSNEGLETVIARSGDEPEEYESGIGVPSMGLYVATEKAVQRGLLPPDTLLAYK